MWGFGVLGFFGVQRVCGVYRVYRVFKVCRLLWFLSDSRVWDSILGNHKPESLNPCKAYDTAYQGHTALPGACGGLWVHRGIPHRAWKFIGTNRVQGLGLRVSSRKFLGFRASDTVGSL